MKSEIYRHFLDALKSPWKHHGSTTHYRASGVNGMLWFTIVCILAFYVGCAWAGYTKDEGPHSQGKRHWSDNALRILRFCRRSPSYARYGFHEYGKHLNEPKNQISIATLIAVVSYTWITHEQYVTGGKNDKSALRAYVYITDANGWVGCGDCNLSDPNLSPAGGWNAIQNRIFVNFSLGNGGKTPAYNVTACFKVEFVKAIVDKHVALNFMCADPNIRFTKATLEPGGIAQRTLPEPTDSDIIKIQWIRDMYLKRGTLVWFGEINYQDVFGRHWTTPFCHYFSPHGPSECAEHNTPNDSD